MDYTKSEDLFLRAHHYNWDDGFTGLNKILKNKNCDFGTALLIYWRAKPESLYEYQSLKEVPAIHRKLYKFLTALEESLLIDKYEKYISFDPENEFTNKDIKLKREIPSVLKEVSEGKIKGTDLIDGKIGIKAWYKAAEAGNIEVLESILESGTDINSTDNWGTALHHCAGSRIIDNSTKIKTMDFLLSKGIKINKKSKWGYPAISTACGLEDENTIEIIKYLVEKGANPNLICADGSNTIFSTCRARNYPVLDFLISKGVNPLIIRKYNHDTPLHYLFDRQTSRINNCFPLVKLLLESKVDPGVLDEGGHSPLDLAQKLAKTRDPDEDMEKAISLLKSYS